MTDNPIFAGPRHRIRRWRNYGMGMGFGVGIEFLFRDDFLTDEAAPLASPRTAEPGPGTETIVDIGNNIAIVSSKLDISAGTGAWQQTGYFSGSQFARVAGLMHHVEVVVTATGAMYWGFLRDTTLDNEQVTAENAIMIFGGAGLMNAVISGTPAISLGQNIALATTYNMATVLRSSGAFNLIKGDVFLEWTLVWVDTSSGFANPWIGASAFHAATDITNDDLRVSQLPSPWDTDFGIATDRLAGARGFGDAFVHEADFIGEFIQTTVPTAGFTSFQFRRQSVNNYWSVVVEPSTDLSLFEVVAGVPTLRGIAVGVVGNGDRIVVIADGTTIRVYEQNTLRITYALAANFQTETDGSLLALGVGGAVSDIVTFPRVLSGAALRALNRVADA